MTGPRYLIAISTGLRLDAAWIRDLAARIDLRIDRQSDVVAVMVEKGATVISLSKASGVLGRVFERDGPPRPVIRLARERRTAICSTKGQELIDSYWGHYIGILADLSDGSMSVLRDPSGGMPCYYAEREGVLLLASDALDLVEAGLIDPLIDWRQLARHLINPSLRSEQTAIAGLMELPAGFRMLIEGRSFRVAPAWSPWPLTRDSVAIRGAGEAADALRAAIDHCVACWASVARHILLSVSGGLDSSIVAVSLKRAGADFSCATLFTDDASGDERAYARHLATALGVRLFERPENVSLVDVRQSQARHLPRPLARAFAQSGHHSLSCLAAEVEADVHMTGGGGDNVFCYLKSAAPLADRLRSQGAGSGTLQTARDLSHMHGAALWTVMKRGACLVWRRNPRHNWPSYRRFLTEGIDAYAWPADHPWITIPHWALPGKVAHVDWLIAIQNHLEDFRLVPSGLSVPPLVSQPIVEICLRIPTWFWCLEGRDRAIARRAFADTLPREIIDRRSKGTPGSFLMQILDANRSAIREMLLGGRLAAQGLIDRSLVSAALDDDEQLRGEDYMHLMRLADVEAWLAAWNSRKFPSAATIGPASDRGARAAGRRSG